MSPLPFACGSPATAARGESQPTRDCRQNEWPVACATRWLPLDTPVVVDPVRPNRHRLSDETGIVHVRSAMQQPERQIQTARNKYMMTDPSTDADKQAAALAAIGEVRTGMLVGLGTGTTAASAIRALGDRVAAGLMIRAVATSAASEELARACGIVVIDFAEVAAVDLTIDGADAIDSRCGAIKGAGGAMLREKIVAAASRRMIVIADGSKRFGSLSEARVRVPVEILPFARASVLATLGEGASLRMESDAPYRTDSGNLIADCRFDLAEPDAIARWLDAIPGVLGHGLFLDEVDAAYIATNGNVARLERSASSS